MASDWEIDRALQAAAEAVVGRRLSTTELDRLKQSFRSKVGGTRFRFSRAIDETFGISEGTQQQKTAASDNLDRLVTDLVNLVAQPPKKP
jgi:hypothetical protein